MRAASFLGCDSEEVGLGSKMTSLTLDDSAVRVGFLHYNTAAEGARLPTALDDLPNGTP